MIFINVLLTNIDFSRLHFKKYNQSCEQNPAKKDQKIISSNKIKSIFKMRSVSELFASKIATKTDIT